MGTGGPPMGMGGPPPGLGGPPGGMGGPPGGPGSPQPQNKVQRIKPADVWDAIRKSLKKGKGEEQDGQD
jgi:hypothetical protein